MGKLGKITFLGERKISMVQMDFDVDDRTLNLLADYALDMIRRDKPALFEYAMRKAIENFAKGDKSWTIKKKRSSKKS